MEATVEQSIAPAAFRINEAARYIGISRANLYRVIRSGRLKIAKVGGRTLIRRVDADRLLAESLTGPDEISANGQAERSQHDTSLFD